VSDVTCRGSRARGLDRWPTLERAGTTPSSTSGSHGGSVAALFEERVPRLALMTDRARMWSAKRATA
jgi:hypothetical protein